MSKNFDGSERRKHKRIRILETFSLAVVIPEKGLMRLPINDLSEEGIGFSIDSELFTEQEFPLEQEQDVNLQVYLNQSLGVSIKAKIKRINSKKKERQIGAEFTEKNTKAHEALQHFVRMLDAAIEAT